MGVDKGSRESTVLVIYCPIKGVSARLDFVNRLMSDQGFDVVTKPITKEICGSNPVLVALDDWQTQ